MTEDKKSKKCTKNEDKSIFLCPLDPQEILKDLVEIKPPPENKPKTRNHQVN